MSEPGFWQIENWHPLSVHFPIAFLMFGTIMMVLSFVLQNEKKIFIQSCGTILLYAGCITAWLSIYTGDISEGAVARKICDPTVLKRHEMGAYTMAYFFSAASILSLAVYFRVLKNNFIYVARVIIVLLMLTGAGYLIYVGHLGASLVYEQGAGVRNHLSDCDGS